MLNFLRFKKNHLAIAFDFLAVPISWYAAYWLRFNFTTIPHHTLVHANYIFIAVFIAQAISFWFFGLYRGLWQFASVPDLIRIIKAVLTATVVILIPIYFFSAGVPRTVIFLYAWFLITILAGARISYRWFKHSHFSFEKGKRTIIIGAGAGGELLLRELAKNQNLQYHPIAIIDNDPHKQGGELFGVRIRGTIDDLDRLVKKYDAELVIIAIPSAKAQIIRDIVTKCEEAHVPYKTIPPLNDVVSGRTNIQALRKIALDDLLGRDPVHLNWEQINKGLTNKKILVSGGGGSIGSEICRQLAFIAPAELIIVDNSEFNLYLIDHELHNKYPNLKLKTKLVSVADEVAISELIKEVKPDIIFHAAAYKHVPLLEDQIRSAMFNNIVGTANIARAAANGGVKTFVLISTDKAVNPTNIMGATKRACEIVCQYYNQVSNTHFLTVRFGNVLGSAGSVVPLFKRQLENGEDLTVTHPEIARYFMTIPEASQLILQATVIGHGGEIFVLDMGEPIKINFLAEQMIRLAGKRLGEDANIVYTGLRPGEKMYEELFYKHEKLLPTEHEKILKSQYVINEQSNVDTLIGKIQTSCAKNDTESLHKILRNMVPEYATDED